MSHTVFWIVLAICIMIHEMGHYTFSRAFGVRVKRVSLFFNLFFTFLKYDPVTKRLDIFSRKKIITLRDDECDPGIDIEASRCLLSIQIAKTDSPAVAARKTGQLEYAKKIEINSMIGGNPYRQATQYCIGWLPFGGYMVPENYGPCGVLSKGPYQQLLIDLGGILFNFITMLLFMSIANTYSTYIGVDGSAPMCFRIIEGICGISFALIAINILPLQGLDGYNSLMCIIDKDRTLGGKVYRVIEWILNLVVMAFFVFSWTGIFDNIWDLFYDFAFKVYDVFVQVYSYVPFKFILW